MESVFDKKGEESDVRSHPVVSPWTCSKCGEHFISGMTRDQHARRKHGRRCILSRKIGDTSTCPNCMTDFRQRFKLVHHARQKRGKERTVVTSDFPSLRSTVIWPTNCGSRTSLYCERRGRRTGHMQLRVDPPRDMTESSLAGLRDELALHFFCPDQCSFFHGRRLLFDFVS